MSVFFVIKMGFCPTNHELPAPLTGTRLMEWVLEQPKGTWNGTPTASTELWLNDDARVLPEMTWQANQPSARYVFKMYVRGKDKKDTRVSVPRASRSAAGAASGRLPGPASAAAAASSSTDEVQVWAYAPPGNSGVVTKAVQFGNQIQIHYNDEKTARKEFKKLVREHDLEWQMDREEAKKRMEKLRREMAFLKGYTSEAEESESEEQETTEEEEQDDIDSVVEVGETEEDAESAGKDVQESKK
jgi:hypothetical protein